MDRIRTKKTVEYVRLAVQVIFFIVFPSAFASAFSAVKEVASAVSGGAELSFTPFAKICLFLLAFTVICGRFFCGYACAFGALGDWVYRLSKIIQKKTGKKIPGIPAKALRYLQPVKFAVLAAVFILCFMGMEGEVSKNSPWTFFSLLISLKLPGADMVAGGVLLALIIIGMAVQERFFCQVLCPMGAIFSMMPVLPSGQLVRDSENCIRGCSICERGCPVSLKLGESEMREGECVRCNKCISTCPRGNISLRYFPAGPADTAWVVIQAAVLLIVLKFVI